MIIYPEHPIRWNEPQRMTDEQLRLHYLSELYRLILKEGYQAVTVEEVNVGKSNRYLVRLQEPSAYSHVRRIYLSPRKED